jgi:hypothetical protein
MSVIALSQAGEVVSEVVTETSCFGGSRLPVLSLVVLLGLRTSSGSPAHADSCFAVQRLSSFRLPTFPLISVRLKL